MKFKENRIILTLLLCSLVLIIVFGSSSWIKLNNINQSLQLKISWLTQELYNIENNIPAAIEQQLIESESHVHSFDVNYLSVNPEENEVTIDLLINFKEANKGGTYHLSFLNDTSLSDQTYTLDYVDGTTFKTTVSLPVTENYQASIVRQEADGTHTMMTSSDMNIPIYDELTYGRFEFQEHHVGLENGNFSLGFSLSLKDLNMDMFGLKEVTIEVWNGDVNLLTRSITEDLTPEPSPEIIEQYYAPEMSTNVDPSYYYNEMDYEQERTLYFFDETFTVDELKDLNLADIEVLVYLETKDGAEEVFPFQY